MHKHRQSPPRRAPSFRLAGVAVLVVIALLSHSLDNCAAHLGGFVKLASSQVRAPSQTSALSNAPCREGVAPCHVCAPVDTPHSDGCDMLSEVAVISSTSQHPVEHQIVALTATVAVIPRTPQAIALSGCLHGRAQAPPTSFSSVVLRSSLPSRAPPISA